MNPERTCSTVPCGGPSVDDDKGLKMGECKAKVVLGMSGHVL